ncbi:SusC/RagA family TonB-linked outer membrane protein [Mucilaginibacter sp. Mucisp84]|uniref:SusC/RagA family TonB-linked outer membrane protein n=1 Tax=Mucilaginibacter sp. Mucisp84 TaxID=3243058 RepID=UPI0039A78375
MNLNFTKNKCVPRGRIKQVLLIMRLTTFLLFAAFMQVSAAGLAQRLTLVQKNVTLKQVFNEVNKQTGYSIVWSVSQVRGNVQVDVDFKDTPLLEALDKCLENTNLTYTIENKTVVIREREPTLVEKIKKALDMAVTVSGKVVDEAGQPMAGVTVKEKGSANGVVTDAKGLFSLSVADNKAMIVFSFVGFEPQEFVVSDIPTGVVIKLKTAENNLKEVVINKGYYNTSQELNTGNVSTVKGKDIVNRPMTDPILALEGKVPGLSITSGGGLPGASSTISLRGKNSISNGNDPLYVIDGIPFSSISLTSSYFGGGAVGIMSPFNNFDSSNIESIEILKDADATAIYGSRGANGVILINTKRGMSGKTKVDMNLSTGVGRVDRRLDLLNTQQYLQMRREAFKNDGKIPGPNDYDINGSWDTTRNTDWQNLLIGGTAELTNLQGSISGGSQTTQFLIGGGYTNQSTVFPGNFGDTKSSFHANLNHVSSNQRFHIGVSASYLNDNSNLPTADITSEIVLPPDAPSIYGPNGDLNWQNDTWTNPLAILRQKARANTDNVIGNLNLDYQIFPGLTIKSNFGYSKSQMDQSITIPISSYSPIYDSFSFLRSIGLANSSLKTWIIEPQVNYQMVIAGGKVEALVGTTFQENVQSSSSLYASDFPNDALIENVAAASSVRIGAFSNTHYRYNAFYGRISYNWHEKYILNLTGRRDGSSRFGYANQFGNFGAIGGAWIFSNEKIIQNALPFLSFGKIRASYGITGNDQLTDYQYLSSYSPYPSTYLGQSGLFPTQISNPFFGWEIVKKIEAGLELGFLKDAIFLNISFYRNRTGNQLVGFSLPDITGFSSIQANLPAIIQNTGLEIELNSTNLKTKNFRWTSSFNLTIPRNILISYPNLAASSYANTFVEGKSLYIKKLYHFTSVDPQTGLYNFEDVNKDGRITNPADIVGNKEIAQKYYGGFQNSFSYKGFQLDIFFQFVKQTGSSYLNNFPRPGFYGGVDNPAGNQPITVLSRWQKPGDVTSVQKFTTSNSSATSAYSKVRASDYQIVDASFIRLKNMALSYSIPQTWQQKMHLQNCKLFLQAENLFTFSKYIGLDPEVRSLAVPPLRFITTGVQITF